MNGAYQYAEAMIETAVSTNECAAAMVMTDTAGFVERDAEHGGWAQRGHLVRTFVDRDPFLDRFHDFEIIELVLGDRQRIVRE